MSALDLFSLTGKVALVTGANKGLGRGIAVALAQAGADIVAISRLNPVETEREIREIGRKFYPILADLERSPESASIVARARSRRPYRYSRQ